MSHRQWKETRKQLESYSQSAGTPNCPECNLNHSISFDGLQANRRKGKSKGTRKSVLQTSSGRPSETRNAALQNSRLPRQRWNQLWGSTRISWMLRADFLQWSASKPQISRKPRLAAVKAESLLPKASKLGRWRKGAMLLTLQTSKKK